MISELLGHMDYVLIMVLVFLIYRRFGEPLARKV